MTFANAYREITFFYHIIIYIIIRVFNLNSHSSMQIVFFPYYAYISNFIDILKNVININHAWTTVYKNKTKKICRIMYKWSQHTHKLHFILIGWIIMMLFKLIDINRNLCQSCLYKYLQKHFYSIYLNNHDILASQISYWLVENLIVISLNWHQSCLCNQKLNELQLWIWY